MSELTMMITTIGMCDYLCIQSLNMYVCMYLSIYACMHAFMLLLNVDIWIYTHIHTSNVLSQST